MDILVECWLLLIQIVIIYIFCCILSREDFIFRLVFVNPRCEIGGPQFKFSLDQADQGIVGCILYQELRAM